MSLSGDPRETGYGDDGAPGAILGDEISGPAGRRQHDDGRGQALGRRLHGGYRDGMGGIDGRFHLKLIFNRTSTGGINRTPRIKRKGDGKTVSKQSRKSAVPGSWDRWTIPCATWRPRPPCKCWPWYARIPTDNLPWPFHRTTWRSRLRRERRWPRPSSRRESVSVCLP